MENILLDLNKTHILEFINDIDEANARLWHNSYDILLLEEKFSKEYTIELSKMAYAMSRPSIILCSNPIKLFFYKLWKSLSEFTNKYITSKKLIYFVLNGDNSIINSIVELSNHDKYFPIVTNEINLNCSK
jgi:hypothetical protein